MGKIGDQNVKNVKYTPTYNLVENMVMNGVSAIFFPFFSYCSFIQM
jgi:hypothetical protein